MQTKVNDKFFKTFDIGYGYLKFLSDNGIVAKEKAVIGLRGESISSGDIVEDIKVINVDNIDYIVGDAVYKLSRKPMTANESENRADNIVFKVLGLYALAMSKPPEGEKITLLTGLPYMNMDETEQVVKAFQGVHHIIFDGKPMTLDIDEVLVIPQGLGAFYSILRQKGTKLLEKKFLLSDLGFHTINHLPISSGDINSDLVETNKDLGIQHAYRKIVAEVNKRYKVNYDFYDVDELLDKGVEKVDAFKGKYRIPIANENFVKEALKEYAQDVWADIIKKYDTTLDSFDEIIFSGGTAQRVAEYLDSERKHLCFVMDNPQDVQVLGYDIITKHL